MRSLRVVSVVIAGLLSVGVMQPGGIVPADAATKVATSASAASDARAVKPHGKGPKLRITVRHSKLKIRGTKRNDRIKVIAEKNDFLVRANGKKVHIRTKRKGGPIDNIRVAGRAGRDKIRMVTRGGHFPETFLQGGKGDDHLKGGDGLTVVDGRNGDDVVKAGSGRSTLMGSDGNDTLVGGSVGNVMLGGNGNDSLTGGSGPNRMRGDLGNDVLVGGNGRSTMFGSDGDDTLLGGAGTNTMNGGSGNDAITGGSGPTTATGGNDDDVLSGGTGQATLLGGEGVDRLVGGAATDKLDGGSGDDTLSQSPGSDQMLGSEGNDTYLLDADNAGGVVSLTEGSGAGLDTVSFSGTKTALVSMNLGSVAAQVISPALTVKLSGASVFENVVGGSLGDTLTGNQLINTFTGGPGRDTFVHNGAGDGVDVVTDMAVSQGDQVRFATDAVGAAGLALNAAGTNLRDDATNSYGFSFNTPVVSPGLAYAYGSTGATATTGQLVSDAVGGDYTVNGGSALVTIHAGSGVTVAGGAGNDRLVDLTGSGNTLRGGTGNDVLAGGAGADQFQFGQSASGTPEPFGTDSVTDFSGGDKVALVSGYTVDSSTLNTPTVTVRDGGTAVGTITASNGHLWVGADFI